MTPTAPHHQLGTVLPAVPNNRVTPPCHPECIETPNHNQQAKEPAANTVKNFPFPSTPEFDTYVGRLQREAHRLAQAKGYREFDADDIASDVVERFMKNWKHNIENYTPERFARVATGQVAITHGRKERAQRAEGVRLVKGTDEYGNGTTRKGRTFVSGNTPINDGDGELFDIAGDRSSNLEDDVIAAVDSKNETAARFRVLTPRERAWIVAVDGQGLSVAELARLENLERETVSRGLNRARRKLRDDRDDNMGDDES